MVQLKESHYFVCRVQFNPAEENPFTKVEVYDSLSRTTTRARTVTDSHVVEYLKLFQKFLRHTVYYDKNEFGGKKLARDPNIILENAQKML